MENLNQNNVTTNLTPSADFVYDDLLDGIVANAPIFQQWYTAVKKYNLVGTQAANDEHMSGARNSIMWMITAGKQNTIDASDSLAIFYKAFIDEYCLSGKDSYFLPIVNQIKPLLDKGANMPLENMLGPVETDLPSRYDMLDKYLDEHDVSLTAFIKQNNALLESRPVANSENNENDINKAKEQLK